MKPNGIFYLSADRAAVAARFGNVGHNDGEFCVTLCFADAADADAFQRRFGGTRIVRGTRDAMQYLPGAEAR
jgi:hypothetical protein